MGISPNKYREIILEYIDQFKKAPELARYLVENHPEETFHASYETIRQNALYFYRLKKSEELRKEAQTKEPETVTITKEEYKLLEGIKEACDAQGLDLSVVKHGWLTNKKLPSLFFKNPAYKEQEDVLKKIDFDKLISNVPRFEYKPVKHKSIGDFDRLVFTDVHVGMEPNQHGFSLYGGVWNEEVLMQRCEIMAQHVLNHQRSNELYIEDLGDFMDGWDAETTRKGHKLPQNMTNKQAYEAGVKFKMALLHHLVPHYGKITLRNICDDNHAGDFGYMVNASVAKVVETSLSNVEVINQEKFMDHYFPSKHHAIITTHGKDSKELKFGLSAKLDPKSQKKIDSYINEHYLSQPECRIELAKGDSHQYILDYASSQLFDYFSYPAFSPSSNWVQTNFDKGESGFVFWNYKGFERFHTNHLFPWE